MLALVCRAGTRRLSVDDRAIDVGQADGNRLGAGPSRLAGRHAHVRQFRKRVGRPRNDQGAGTPPAMKQRILNDDAGHGVGCVREMERRADVARRINAVIRRAQPIVDLTPFAPCFTPAVSRFSPSTFGDLPVATKQRLADGSVVVAPDSGPASAAASRDRPIPPRRRWSRRLQSERRPARDAAR